MPTLNPGDNIQAAVTANPNGTSFTLNPGVYTLASAITPKTGNSFIGVSGAILDGTGWATTDTNQGAIRAHNAAILNVTIQNLIIRNMPMKGIHAFGGPAGWLVENCEIHHCKYGFSLANTSTIRSCIIHDNTGVPASPVTAERGGGYNVFRATTLLIESCEFYNNGPEQKVVQCNGITFRSNYLHDNYASGIWYDGENINSLIESNTITNHPAEGIFYEVSGSGVIRNNTIRRAGMNGVGSGIFISTSQDVEIYGNLLTSCRRGIQYFVDCARVGQGGIIHPVIFDLKNNNAHDNTTSVSTTAGDLSSLIGSLNCTAAALVPYTNGSKNLIFQNNRYLVPSLTGAYWYWPV